MWRVLKYAFYLAVIAAVSLAVYAALSDLPAPKEDIRLRVEPVAQ